MEQNKIYFITGYGLMAFDLRDSIPNIQAWLEQQKIPYWLRVGFDRNILCKEYLEACYSYLPAYNAEQERRLLND